MKALMIALAGLAGLAATGGDAPVQVFPDGARVAFFGDSITRNGGAMLRVAARYRAAFPDRDVRFYNVGISGGGLEAAEMYFDKYLAAVKPTHVVFAFGVNNSCPPAVFRERYAALVGRMEALGASVVLRAITPYNEFGKGTVAVQKGRNENHRRIAEEIRAFATEHGLPVLDDFSRMSKCLVDGEEVFLDDRVHPNDYGQWRMAETLLVAQGLGIEVFRPQGEVAAISGLSEWFAESQKLANILSCEWLLVRDEALGLEAKLAKVRSWLAAKGPGTGADEFLGGLARRYLDDKPREDSIRIAMDAAWDSARRTAFGNAVPTQQEFELKSALPGIFAKSAAHYRALDAAATPLMKDEKGHLRVPHGILRRKTGKNELDMRSIYWWTSGHFPGSLWFLYEATGDEFFKNRAKAWTEIVAPNAKVADNHDVGFIMYCSFGNAKRILKTDAYDGLLAEAAESLSTRFHEGLGLIRSWGRREDAKEFLVIPDNMMNLELLEAVSGNGEGAKKFDKIARSHADVSMRHHFRADGGCYHVLNYDQRPGFLGAVQDIRRGQGLSCETAWSRGQSWSIYGYTMMYRFTNEPRYLEFAQKLADYAMNHPNMPADGVPYWDFGAPGEERDSSAASIMASALLELSGFVTGEEGAKYRAFAVKQLLSLASPAYFSEGDEIGHWLLKHGVGHKPATEIDTPLDYGDYYFLEALLRFSRMNR